MGHHNVECDKWSLLLLTCILCSLAGNWKLKHRVVQIIPASSFLKIAARLMLSKAPLTKTNTATVTLFCIFCSWTLVTMSTILSTLLQLRRNPDMNEATVDFVILRFYCIRCQWQSTTWASGRLSWPAVVAESTSASAFHIIRAEHPLDMLNNGHLYVFLCLQTMLAIASG